MTQSENQITTLLVARKDDEPMPTTVYTPPHVPDIVLTFMSPLAVIVVRTLRVYLQSLLGLLTGGSVAAAVGLLPAGIVPPEDLWHALRLAAGMALGPAVACALQNSVELLARLDEKLPQLRP